MTEESMEDQWKCDIKYCLQTYCATVSQLEMDGSIQTTNSGSDIIWKPLHQMNPWDILECYAKTCEQFTWWVSY